MSTDSKLLLVELDETKPEKEPALKVGTATGTVAGLISLVLYFAPNLLSESQMATLAIIGAFAIPVVTALFARGRVWSVASVKAVVEEAVAEALKTAEGLRKSVPPPVTSFPPDDELGTL